jgi:hypothetical protein
MNGLYTWLADLADVGPFLLFVVILVGLGMILGFGLNEVRWREWRRSLRRPK